MQRGVFVFLFLAACGGSHAIVDYDLAAPTGDADTVADLAARKDLGKVDAAAGVDDILGTLAGTHDQVIAELTSPDPSLLFDELTFVDGEMYAELYLSDGGKTLFETANAGGSSTESEVMSFEVLHFEDEATLLATETEIKYDPPPDGGANTITDILVSIDGKKVGVSVTRAYKPANQGAQTDAEVKALLEKKLTGIIASSAHVNAQDKWVKQILHVFSATTASRDAIGRVWPTIDASIKADTIVLVTTTTGGGFIYCHPTPPLGQECP